MIPALQAVIAKYPVAAMAQGDVYILNDPYCGGTHLPDITLFMPGVRRRARGRVQRGDGRITRTSAAWRPARSRPTPPRSTRKACASRRSSTCEAGDVNETLDAMLRYNIRLPDTFMGDLNAQLAACTVGARRLSELCAALRRGQLDAHLRAAARPLRGDDARGAAQAAGRHVPLRRLPRQRRRRPRAPGAHRGRGHRQGRHHPFRLHRHRPAAARAAQLRAFGRAGRRLLRGARAHRCADPHQRRLLPPGDAAPARRLAGQSDGARAGECAHGHDQAHLRRDGQRVRRSRCPSACPPPRRACR